MCKKPEDGGGCHASTVLPPDSGQCCDYKSTGTVLNVGVIKVGQVTDVRTGECDDSTMADSDCESQEKRQGLVNLKTLCCYKKQVENGPKFLIRRGTPNSDAGIDLGMCGANEALLGDDCPEKNSAARSDLPRGMCCKTEDGKSTVTAGPTRKTGGDVQASQKECVKEVKDSCSSTSPNDDLKSGLCCPKQTGEGKTRDKVFAGQAISNSDPDCKPGIGDGCDRANDPFLSENGVSDKLCCDDRKKIANGAPMYSGSQLWACKPKVGDACVLTDNTLPNDLCCTANKKLATGKKETGQASKPARCVLGRICSANTAATEFSWLPIPTCCDVSDKVTRVGMRKITWTGGKVPVTAAIKELFRSGEKKNKKWPTPTFTNWCTQGKDGLKGFGKKVWEMTKFTSVQIVMTNVDACGFGINQEGNTCSPSTKLAVSRYTHIVMSSREEQLKMFDDDTMNLNTHWLNALLGANGFRVLPGGISIWYEVYFGEGATKDLSESGGLEEGAEGLGNQQWAGMVALEVGEDFKLRLSDISLSIEMRPLSGKLWFKDNGQGRGCFQHFMLKMKIKFSPPTVSIKVLGYWAFAPKLQDGTLGELTSYGPAQLDFGFGKRTAMHTKYTGWFTMAANFEDITFGVNDAGTPISVKQIVIFLDLDFGLNQETEHKPSDKVRFGLHLSIPTDSIAAMAPGYEAEVDNTNNLADGADDVPKPVYCDEVRKVERLKKNNASAVIPDALKHADMGDFCYIDTSTQDSLLQVDMHSSGLAESTASLLQEDTDDVNCHDTDQVTGPTCVNVTLTPCEGRNFTTCSLPEPTAENTPDVFKPCIWKSNSNTDRLNEICKAKPKCPEQCQVRAVKDCGEASCVKFSIAQFTQHKKSDTMTVATGDKSFDFETCGFQFELHLRFETLLKNSAVPFMQGPAQKDMTIAFILRFYWGLGLKAAAVRTLSHEATVKVYNVGVVKGIGFSYITEQGVMYGPYSSKKQLKNDEYGENGLNNYGGRPSIHFGFDKPYDFSRVDNSTSIETPNEIATQPGYFCAEGRSGRLAKKMRLLELEKEWLAALNQPDYDPKDASGASIGKDEEKSKAEEQIGDYQAEISEYACTRKKWLLQEYYRNWKYVKEEMRADEFGLTVMFGSTGLVVALYGGLSWKNKDYYTRPPGDFVIQTSDDDVFKEKHYVETPVAPDTEGKYYLIDTAQSKDVNVLKLIGGGELRVGNLYPANLTTWHEAGEGQTCKQICASTEITCKESCDALTAADETASANLKTYLNAQCRKACEAPKTNCDSACDAAGESNAACDKKTEEGYWKCGSGAVMCDDNDEDRQCHQVCENIRYAPSYDENERDCYRGVRIFPNTTYEQISLRINPQQPWNAPHCGELCLATEKAYDLSQATRSFISYVADLSFNIAKSMFTIVSVSLSVVCVR